MFIRPVLVVLLISIWTHCSYAQTKYLKIKSGLNVSSAVNVDNSSPKLGYHFGIGGNLKLSEDWAFQPEVLYVNEGYHNSSFKYGLNYINLPLLFKYQFKTFFFYGGPQVGLLLFARQIDLNSKEKQDVTYKYNSLEISLATGLGFMITENMGVDGRCTIDYANQSNDPDNINNLVFQVSLFYILK